MSNPKGCSAVHQGGLEIGKPAPYFSATAYYDPDEQFIDVSLDDYKGKYLILFFYPMDFTFVCPTEIRAFSEKVADFKKVNCEIIACSTDSVYSYKAWAKTPRNKQGLGPVNIPLMSDQTMVISKAYGVHKDDQGVANRSLFIIDNLGNLRQVIINHVAVSCSVNEAMRLVQAYQHVDKNGEVCPVNWKPGQPGIKVDPNQHKSRNLKRKKRDTPDDASKEGSGDKPMD